MSLHLNKPGLRALGIAESFVRSLPYSILAGVVMRADLRVDGLAYARAAIGGDDATQAVLDIYHQLDRKDINAILLEGAVISWFNVVDLQEIWRKTGRPLICLTYHSSPGLERCIGEHFPESEENALLSGSRRDMWSMCEPTEPIWRRLESCSTNSPGTAGSPSPCGWPAWQPGRRLERKHRINASQSLSQSRIKTEC
ncbi:MAG: DUF99 family protein [Methanothrix sp.]|nr:DUF99 family protein [Methanothrix sp.]